MNTQESTIKEVMISKYGEYKFLVDGSITYKRLGNTRRLRFYKLYDILQGYGVTATAKEVLAVIFKYRSNPSRVTVNK